MGLKCYLLHPTDRVARYLRRFEFGDESKCAESGMGYHDAMARIEDEPVKLTADGYIDNSVEWPFDDPRWPAQCACGYEFTPEDQHQLFINLIYKRSDNEQELTLREAEPGAMWDATWYPMKGPDGRSLVVKCPNGHDWTIDGQASNCTMPDDGMQQHHHCWIRHGEPPNITVDKNGVTCGAGAGSIQAGDYHGFLRNGEFT